MRQYFLNMLMAFDQFISTVLGGHPDDTVSQRLGRAYLGGSESVILLFSMRMVDKLAKILAGEDQHCIRSLSGKTNAKELWNWGGSRSMIKVEE